ncbi:DUF2946 family protein [Dongia deserti]|uniref:DUF2946 family protein n=1 Tax=Dongia deserti TaxID=2268030 RepID=UPI000E656C31|nr:DUF2946 family protein [Dongia deserti]
MNRVRRQTERTWRQWLGLCLVLLLTFAPPFNLAGVDLALQAQAESGAHQAHGHDRHSHHHSGLAHHSSGGGCLECLVLGGMSLAGAAALPHPAPALHAIGSGWSFETRAWDSRGVRIIVCRGPPALA